MVVSVARTQLGCIVGQKVRVLRDIGEAWLALAPPISPFGHHSQWSLGTVKMGREGGVLCLTEGSNLQ